ncbi:MAG: chemotaxis protein CheW [Nevskia sp.]|jgi:purine-binding chemotaxis protein CheW|nr:chemotaxis protein CheW [Nevskia sp.]MCK9384091.1 chemotaxis protein CheW [Nevskia sp.]
MSTNQSQPFGTQRLDTSAANEFLTFTLGNEEYGVDILKVQEIRGYDTVTHIPDTPAFIKGVINLRGTIVPVVDLRIKFNLGRVEYNELTVMIVLNIAGRVVGVVVDGVSDVITLEDNQIMPPPEFGGTLDTRYLAGLGTVDQRMLILVDIEKLMGSTEMNLFNTDAALAA